MKKSIKYRSLVFVFLILLLTGTIFILDIFSSVHIDENFFLSKEKSVNRNCISYKDASYLAVYDGCLYVKQKHILYDTISMVYPEKKTVINAPKITCYQIYDDCIYYTSDHVLYCFKNGKKQKLLSDAGNFLISNGIIYYYEIQTEQMNGMILKRFELETSTVTVIDDQVQFFGMEDSQSQSILYQTTDENGCTRIHKWDAKNGETIILTANEQPYFTKTGILSVGSYSYANKIICSPNFLFESFYMIDILDNSIYFLKPDTVHSRMIVRGFDDIVFSTVTVLNFGSMAEPIESLIRGCGVIQWYPKKVSN